MAVVAEIVKWITAGVTAVVDGTPRTAASVNAGLTDLANRTRWLKDRMYDLLLGAPKTISAADTGTDRLTVTSHGIPANTAVQVFAANGGSLPGGLAPSVVYYVGVVDADTIYLSATIGPGAAVDLTAGFSGDVYVQIVQDWMSVLLIADSTWGYGKLTSLVVFLAGAQAITGAKTFSDIMVSGTNKYKLTSRSLTRTIDTMWVNNTSGINGLTPHCATLVGGSGDTWYSGLDLPHGQVITEISVRLDPANVGALPGTMPAIAITKFNRATGATTTFGTGTDTSASSVIYSALHDMTISGMSETIDRSTYHYYLGVVGSSGATPANDINMIGATATITCTSLGAWA
jgi:hypothetical protein